MYQGARSGRPLLAAPQWLGEPRARAAVAAFLGGLVALHPGGRRARLPSHGDCHHRAVGARARRSAGASLSRSRSSRRSSSTSRSTSCCGCRCPGASSSAWRSEPVTASVLAQAFALVFDPYVLWVIVASASFGLFVGAVPGLTATMATALLVPVTFFMPPVPAIASHRHRHGDGDLRRRYPELPAAHARHAGLRRVHRRGLRDDEEGPGRDRRSARAWCSR